MPTPPAPPQLAEIACWRFVPAARPLWQPGILRHDEDIGGWSWDDGEGPEDVHPDIPKAYWTPPLLDAHTHLGDAFLRPERHLLPRDLVRLVAPPDGYKHRRLRETDTKTIRQGMHARARAMTEKGTAHTLDFREGGAPGLALLGQAAQKTDLGITAYGRPATRADARDDWTHELEGLLELPGVGIGLSALSDLPGDLPERAADACRTRRRPLALHLSERIHEDMERALGLDPALLVHLNEATKDELEMMAEAGALAVTCPTSNRFFDLRPPLHDLWTTTRDAGLQVAIGSDNAMLSDGDLKDEARAVAKLLPEADLGWLLTALSWTPWRHLGLGPEPDQPGLLWGIHRKTPNTHPDETHLADCAGVVGRTIHQAPI